MCARFFGSDKSIYCYQGSSKKKAETTEKKAEPSVEEVPVLKPDEEVGDAEEKADDEGLLNYIIACDWLGKFSYFKDFV